MNTETKIIIIILIVLIIASSLALIFMNKKETINMDENLNSIKINIKKLNKDLKNLLETNLNYDIDDIFKKVFYGKEEEIIKCVQSEMMKKGISLQSLNMNGNDMKEPIISIYNNNKQLYTILAKCNFLELIGSIIAIAGWVSSLKGNEKNNPKLLQKVLACLDTINWEDINVWKNMSDENGEVMNCIKIH